MKDLALYINPSLGYTTDYIVLDSKFRLPTEDKNTSITSFVWGYSGGQFVRNFNVNSCSDIQNIVRMRLQNFSMPYGIEIYDGLSSYSRISVVIEELSAQSYIVSASKRAHWILRLDEYYNTPTSKRIEFNVDDFNHGEYWFNKPITYLDAITVKIGSPTLQITFLYDRDTCTATYGNPTIITTTYAHGFTTSTYITLSNFTTGAVDTDKAIIDQMNNQKEILATVTGANTLTIPIDTSTITPSVGLTFNIFFEDRRIILNIECLYKKEVSE